MENYKKIASNFELLRGIRNSLENLHSNRISEDFRRMDIHLKDLSREQILNICKPHVQDYGRKLLSNRCGALLSEDDLDILFGRENYFEGLDESTFFKLLRIKNISDL